MFPPYGAPRPAMGRLPPEEGETGFDTPIAACAAAILSGRAKIAFR
jgi:hypothetical protein